MGRAMREEGSPAPVIDDIIGGLVPDFCVKKLLLKTMGRPGYEANNKTSSNQGTLSYPKYCK